MDTQRPMPSANDLLKYQLSPEAWKEYLADKNARRRPHPGLLKTVDIEGGSAGRAEQRIGKHEAAEGQAD